MENRKNKSKIFFYFILPPASSRTWSCSNSCWFALVPPLFGQCCLLVCVCVSVCLCVLWLCWFFFRFRFPFYHLFSAAANFVFGRNEAAAGPTKGATKRALGVTRSTRFSLSNSLSCSANFLPLPLSLFLSSMWHVLFACLSANDMLQIKKGYAWAILLRSASAWALTAT